MKFFFPLIFLFSLNAMSQNIKYKHTRPELRPKVSNRNQIFKGLVKEVRSKTEYFNKDHSEIPSYTNWKFDQIGNLTYYSYTIRGNNGDRYVHIFDKKDNLISTEWYNETTNELYTTTKYKYDDLNRLEFKEVFNKMGELRQKKKYLYKNSDKPYEIHIYEDNLIDLRKPIGYFIQELSEINKLEYDQRGNLIKIEKLNGNNELESTIKLVFDGKDRCIEEAIYVPEPGYAFLYEFNDEDNSVTFFNSRNGLKEILHYDKYLDGKLISISTFGNSKVINEKVYKYDDKGNLLSMITLEDGNKSSKMENVYTFDKFSNPITIDVFVDDIKIESKTLEFEYY